MGYSKNRAAVIRVESFLKQLVAATNDLSWPSENAHMLGYYLREAMTVAKKLNIEPYHELKDKWTIRNRGMKVVAEYKLVEPLSGLAQAASKMEIPHAASLAELVGAAIQYRTPEMTFPNAALTPQEYPMLYKWCEANGYYMIVSDAGVITLTKTDPQGVQWTPEDAT